MAGDLGILEFDLGQKWAKGLRIHFCDAAESAQFKDSNDFQNSYSLKQIHSKKLVNWSASTSLEKFRETEADGFIARGEAYKNSLKKLVIRTADCCPLFYVDRENECAAAIHAGWRGLAQGIHLTPFKEGFDPKNTWIWCGPCLNGDTFEVSEDMWSQFPKDIQNNSDIFAQKKSTGEAAATGKRFFDCWKYLSLEFKKLDVALFYNVEVDTFTDTSFNSYRRWRKDGNVAPTPHNYSWISFV
jgi:copper oxidase (laccase) domain-containing protein